MNWHLKHKKKLVILLGYQLSNLGWIGAWVTAEHYGLPSIPFVACVFLICLADILIIWKEL
jgi:hypothetical protein